MKDRIRKLRKNLDLTQQEFAGKIGTTANVLTNYETGRRNPSSSVINNICKTFNVNEQWLRTGEGEMFSPNTSSTLDALVKEYRLPDEARVMIEKFVCMRPEARKAVIDYCKEVSVSLQQVSSMETAAYREEIPAQNSIKMTVEEAEAAYIKSRLEVAQQTKHSALNTTISDTENNDKSEAG